jgi:hypothetical protein
MGEQFKGFLILFASWLVAIVPWGSSLSTWQDAITTGNLFPFLGITGGVILAWLGQSPIMARTKPN